MDPETVHAQIEHHTAELRALFPEIRDCHTALVQWKDPEGSRYSLHLDIRSPQRQTIVSGPAEASAGAAIEAACRRARELLKR